MFPAGSAWYVRGVETPAIEMLLLAVAWAVRELVPVVARRLRKAEELESAQSRTLADSSGGFAPVANEQIATRREVEDLRRQLKDNQKHFAAAISKLQRQVEELDKVIAVLKDRAGMPV